ncbi:MAG: HAMP domain-containing sensor histidine kinase [Oscillospiraceae bacterium]
MAIKSITQRWIINSLCVILLIVFIGGVAFFFSVKNYHYSGVKQAVLSRANMISGTLSRTIEDNEVDFNAEFRDIIENFDEKSKIEITAIDHNGQIALSSSGFSYNKQMHMQDYDTALESANGVGMNIAKTDTGEKIMAITTLIPTINGEYSAIRYVTSLKQVDKLLLLYMGVFSLASLVVIVLVMVSGFYFIKSIVIPVRDVGAVARKFATGDMSARIVKTSNDELGELSDIINYMADEISAADEVKNEFISSVSHELRTPLTAIKGWSETLMSSNENDKETMKKGMRVITSETEMLSIMVEELLDFSRMQNGIFKLFKNNIDILAELGEAVLIYTQRAKRDNINLVYDEPLMVPFIFGDKNRLRQVFINIIDNALKYSDAGDTVMVEINATESDIFITVEDTGCGISPEDLPKVKTKFYKANLTRRGSGIGLAVANEIILMHDGDITIKSTLTVGTKVTIRLPINLKKGEERKTEISSAVELNNKDERDGKIE